VHSPNRSVASRRIALLDVDGDARSYVAQALRDDGFAVTVATSGEDLLRALADAPFDVALVDADRLEMPVDDFLTRTDGMPLVRMGIRLTADVDGWGAFLTKPFLMKDLYGAIDAALDQANVAAPSPSGGPHEG
jgi:DNA-binding response OmpR family regulator